MNLADIQIPKAFLVNIDQNNEYNKKVIKYYKQFALETELNLEKDRLTNKAELIGNCNKHWIIEKYEKQKVKDFIKTNLCKDKFCNNCKKVKQASRMARFIPEIEKYSDKGLYHLVLTNPNVKGSDLLNTVKTMFKAFATFIEYFKGKKKIKGLDFEQYGYLGAIRSLEITYNKDVYHPHLHVLICMTGSIGNKTIKNKYSYNKFDRDNIRYFSKLEVRIQRIWFLLMNGIKVTNSNIHQYQLEKNGETFENVGYSCMMDKFKEGDYHELFKYMTKVKGELDGFMSFENFKLLHMVLHHLRQIQGYGVFFRLKDEDMEDEIDNAYNEFINSLKVVEDPELIAEKPVELIFDIHYTLISRKLVYKYLREIVLDDGNNGNQNLIKIDKKSTLSNEKANKL